jgi:hypothetical protein
MLGHNFVPDPIHAGGLRYHGTAPLVSLNQNITCYFCVVWLGCDLTSWANVGEPRVRAGAD